MKFNKITVKIGSNVLTRPDGTLDVTRMSALVDQIAVLHKKGVEIVIVSSGAVASGRSLLGLTKKMDVVDQRQRRRGERRARDPKQSARRNQHGGTGREGRQDGSEAEGRSTDHWIDFDLFGHQLSAHLGQPPGAACEGQVDGHAVPIPHFGAILDPALFRTFAERLRRAGIVFLMEPGLRFEGKPGEQETMFFLDPDGNALEFKAFVRRGEVFARQDEAAPAATRP